MKILKRLRGWYWLRFAHHETPGEQLAQRMRGQPNTVLYNYGPPFIPERWRQMQEQEARRPPQGLPVQAQMAWREGSA